MLVQSVIFTRGNLLQSVFFIIICHVYQNNEQGLQKQGLWIAKRVDHLNPLKWKKAKAYGDVCLGIHEGRLTAPLLTPTACAFGHRISILRSKLDLKESTSIKACWW